MNNILTCPICMEKYDLDQRQPRLLCCFHTFCGECTQKMVVASANSIACPFCAHTSQLPASGVFPLNYALRDIVEISLVSQDSGKLCDVHEGQHLATHWCVECEQGMCNELVVLHSKMKSSATHHIHKVGVEAIPPPTQKPILCRTHGKELELVCIQDGSLVCVSCVVTTHHGHRCETTEESFAKQRDNMSKLVANAQLNITEFKKTVESVRSEKDAVASNKSSVECKIITYFDKISQQIITCKNDLLSEVNTLASGKEKRLQAQLNGLLSSIDNISGTAQQLEVMMNGGGKTKALAMMEQLQGHLNIVSTSEYTHPVEYANISLLGALPVKFSARVAVEATVSAKHSSVQQQDPSSPLFFPLIITACNEDGEQIITKASSFVVEAVDNSNNAIVLSVTDKKDGTFMIQPGHDYKHTLPKKVDVKVGGEHVKGSPVVRKYTWSDVSCSKVVRTGNIVTTSDSNSTLPNPKLWYTSKLFT